MLVRIGRWCFRKPWWTFGAWFVAMAAVFGTVGSVGAAFDSSFEIPSSESRDGFDVMEEHFDGLGSGFTGSIVFKADQGVDDPEVQATMTKLFEEVRAIEGVFLRSPYESDGVTLVAQQGASAGRIAYADLNLAPTIDQVESGLVGEEISAAVESVGANQIDGLQVEIGGAALATFEPPETELIGLAFAVVILILAMGSVLAMGTTIGVAVAGVATGAGLITLLSHITPMPEFATSIGLMIGLGVGIDYALFIVNRYRESLKAGFDPEGALTVALDTAGRSVIFAGVTVVVSLLGLLLIGLSFIAGMGIGAAVTVAVVMAASVTLLPAAIGLIRTRVETNRVRGVVAASFVALALLGLGFGISPFLVGLPLAILTMIVGSLPFTGNPLKRLLPPRKEKPIRETVWYRLSRTIQAKPWLFAIGGTLFLLVLTAPVLSLRMGFSDEGNYAETTTTRKAYDLLAAGFGPGSNGPLLIATEISSPADLEELGALSTALGATDGVAFASPPFPSEDGQAAIIQVLPTTSPQDEATADLVQRLRRDVVPAAMGDSDLAPAVTGLVAANSDFTSFLAGRIILFFGAVLGLSFLLLMAVFRSLLVPLKAVILNMLSIGAAYGIVVAIFQWGWLSGVFGVEPAPIEPFIPMMMFAIVFGLSMDYEVFLLSRVKEEYERTGDAVNSVADGLASTARVITAAAAIMVVVFGSFLFEEDRIIKLFGVGLSLAVLLDASVVRMLLVPSTMQLLGARNWWLPGWLDRILPQLNVEGGHHEPPSQPGQPDRELEPALN